MKGGKLSPTAPQAPVTFIVSFYVFSMCKFLDLFCFKYSCN